MRIDCVLMKWRLPFRPLHAESLDHCTSNPVTSNPTTVDPKIFFKGQDISNLAPVVLLHSYDKLRRGKEVAEAYSTKITETKSQKVPNVQKTNQQTSFSCYNTKTSHLPTPRAISASSDQNCPYLEAF